MPWQLAGVNNSQWFHTLPLLNIDGWTLVVDKKSLLENTIYWIMEELAVAGTRQIKHKKSAARLLKICAGCKICICYGILQDTFSWWPRVTLKFAPKCNNTYISIASLFLQICRKSFLPFMNANYSHTLFICSNKSKYL